MDCFVIMKDVMVASQPDLRHRNRRNWMKYNDVCIYLRRDVMCYQLYGVKETARLCYSVHAEGSVSHGDVRK